MAGVSIDSLYRFGLRQKFLRKRLAMMRGVKFESDEVEIGKGCALGGHILIGPNVSIGDFTSIYSKGELRIHRGVGIGERNIIRSSHPEFVSNSEIKEDTHIGFDNQIDLSGGVTIGKHCFFTNEIRIFSHKHEIPSRQELVRSGALTKEPVIIGDDVFIGYRAVILGNVTIGNGAVVATGAVVTKDIEEYAIVGGVPARKIAERK